MQFPFYIAKRYLVAKKSHNAINIISGIAMIGVAVSTLALIVVLSVFNGFENLVVTLQGSFYPDLQLTPVMGKSFVVDEPRMEMLKRTKGVKDIALVVEDKALLRYNNLQTIAVIKGVTDNYRNITGVDTMIREGVFSLRSANEDMAIVGQGIAYYLGINLDVPLNYRPPLAIYVPKRLQRMPANPERAINRGYITPAGVFAIEQEFDSKYVLVPINFARDLFGYRHEISKVEIKLDSNTNRQEAQREIMALFGDGFEVKNRFQQNELFYKTMQAEKWAIFLILLFILAVASFNVIGSLTMLILEKRADISILSSMGADRVMIKRIFQTEGWFISVIGALAGLVLGLLICWLQIRYKLVKLQGSGSFVIDAYPVDIQYSDVAIIFTAVLFTGYFAAWFPVRYVMRGLAVK